MPMICAIDAYVHAYVASVNAYVASVTEEDEDFWQKYKMLDL